MISDEIALRLRELASAGAGASAMVAALKKEVPQREFSYFFAMAAFRKAFDLRMTPLLLLPEAQCLGGGSYDDDELDALLRDHINGSET